MPEQSRQRDLVVESDGEPASTDRVGTARASADESMAVASTVVLLRGHGADREVLMLERPDRGSFAAAWVFPGGKLDAVDGDVRAPESERAAAVVAGVREVAEETGIVLDPAELVATAVWTPPVGAPVRLRTWFFRATAPALVLTDALTLSVDEVVHAEWARPADILHRHGRGELMLYPPTWVTLHELAAEFGVDPGAGPGVTLGAASDGACEPASGGVADYRTRVRKREGGLLFLWQGDAEYDDMHDGGAPSGSPRHRLDTRTLPWVYQRS